LITFESGSRLSQPEALAFAESGLTSIHLPASVTFIGERCFSDCGSVASITFDPVSKFRGSGVDLLAGLPLDQTELREAIALLDDYRCVKQHLTCECRFFVHEFEREDFVRGACFRSLSLPFGFK
jgi:hypothetical protein